MSRIYSPNQTADWLRCPQYRHLKRRWVPNLPVSKLDVAAGLGRSIAEGVDHINQALKSGFELTPDTAEEAAQLGLAASEIAKATATQILMGFEEQGVPDSVSEYASKLPELAALGTAGYLHDLPKYLDYDVIDSELTLPSGSRLDIAARHRASRRLEVIDLKTKLTIRPKQLASMHDTYGPTGLGSQLYHYCHEWGQVMKEAVYDYRIHLLVVLPSPKLYEFQYHIPMERYGTWLDSMSRIWEDMEMEDLGIRLPYQRRESCSTVWGKCSFYRACHELYYDETLMSLNYTRITQAEVEDAEEGEE